MIAKTMEEQWKEVVNYFRYDPSTHFGFPEREWTAYIRDTSPIRVEDGAWFIRAQNEAACRWLGDRFAALAARYLTGLTGERVERVIFTGETSVM